MTMAGLLPPGSTLGIVGGGQLGRMLAIAAAELGYRTHIYCPEEHAPAFEVANEATVAGYGDLEAFARFAKAVDVVTIEFENIPGAGLRHIAPLVPVRPKPDVLEICQHRVKEKAFIQKLGIGTAPFVPVGSRKELPAALEKTGLPAVLKTASMGYDGKGQWKIEDEGALPDIAPGEYILEAFIEFSMEISVIAARGADGSMMCYPAVQNIHKNHILHQTIAPAPIPGSVATEAESIARRIAEALGLVGLLAVEMFVTKKGLLVNELAPRPHNSGHWTLDACVVSQFEQCVRAVCGLPLAALDVCFSAIMTNLIGGDVNEWEHYLSQPNTRLHLYGKKEARPGRKMGHVTQLRL